MASIKKYEGKKGTTYRVLWREGGKQRSGTVPSHRAAVSLKAEVEARLRTGQALTGDNPTVDDWHAQWMLTRPDLRVSSHETNSTLYRVHVSPVIGFKRLKDVQPLDVQGMLTALAGHRAPATVARVYQETRQLFSDAVIARLISVTPCVGIRLPRQVMKDKTVFDHDEIASIAESAGHYRPLVYFLAYSGLRINEALALKVKDYDGSGVQVRGTLSNGEVLPPKTQAGNRRVPLPDFVKAILNEHVKGKSPNSWIFVGPRGALINSRNFNQRVFKPLAGRGTVHDLRHTAVSHWIAAEIDLPRLSKWAGHADPAFTLKQYASFFPADESAHMTKLNARIADKIGEVQDGG